MVRVDGPRLLSRLRALAEIGARPGGGVNRQAFTPTDAAARRLALAWAADIGLEPATDAIGNLYLRLSANTGDSDEAAAPVLSGSHIDTQPAGGWLDGAYGVVAAIEALQAIKDAGVPRRRPIEAVAWVNEEGCRYHPGLMGSTAFKGALDLDVLRNQTSPDGVALGDAIAACAADLPDLPVRTTPYPLAGLVEAHIEQGPILEREAKTIGVVTGVQGLYWLQVEISGEQAHAGTAPLAGRRDALLAAARIVAALSEALADPTDTTRFTVGRLEAHPNSPNTVADRVRFTIDLRHPDAATLDGMRATIERIAVELAAPCDCEIAVLERLAPTPFDGQVRAAVADAAAALAYPAMDIISGGSHDAAALAGLSPTGMIFIPCTRGVSHHPDEDADDAALVAGADVLASVLARLAGAR